MISRKHFRQFAKAMAVSLGDHHSMVAAPKEFSTGSLGWFVGDKIVVNVGGQPVTVQVGINLTVVGSKSIPP